MTVERRGRGSTGRPKKLPKDVEKDLLAEVQRLRAENDYLKNLQTIFHNQIHSNDMLYANNKAGCL